jgi:putative phosphoesterase
VDELSGADLIIHAGDYTAIGLLNELRRRGNFRGVHGNLDAPEIKRELPALETISVGGFSIGINHPSEGGTPFGIEDRIRAKFQDVDAVIFGHTHRTKNEYRNGVLCFNPGSATGTFPASARTFGIITVGKEMRGEILRA